jgi:hypothetical protein
MVAYGPRKNRNGLSGAEFFKLIFLMGLSPQGLSPQPLPYLSYLFPPSIRHTPYPYQGDTMFLSYPIFLKNFIDKYRSECYFGA